MKRQLEREEPSAGARVKQVNTCNDIRIDYKPPTNPLVGPLLTDMYQISMTYAHWKSNRHNDHAIFDLFYRTNPFHGEFAVSIHVHLICSYYFYSSLSRFNRSSLEVTKF